ncbi:MAG: FxsA family protein [Rhodospirillales bacterium]|nr:FxsA family protein [Rhodospirillales bacterium]
MSYLLFALFIGLPILEISVFISVGGEIGLGWTLATVILTAMIGTWMLKRQGLKTLFRLQDQLNQGQLPLREVFDGFCLLLAGAFLLTPGFVTDGVGFLLFMPPFRSRLMASISRVITSPGHLYGPESDKRAGSVDPVGKDMEGNVHSPVIDGEFQDLTGQNETEAPKTGASETEPDSVVRRIDK